MQHSNLPSAQSTPRPLAWLIVLILGLALGWSISVINIATAMGGPLAMSGLYLKAAGMLLGLGSFAVLLYWLKSASHLVGSALLIAGGVALSLVLWQFWQYPTVDGAFYSIRDQLTDFSWVPPEPSAHVLAVLLSAILLYLGLEYLVLADTSFFKASLTGKLIIAALCLTVLGLTLISTTHFFAEPRFIYLSIPAGLAVFALLGKRFNSAALLLATFAASFGLLFALALLSYYWFIVLN